jgi:hypothetical protein
MLTPRVCSKNEHVSLDATTCQAKQLPVVPGGVGAGGASVVDDVVMPLPGPVMFQSIVGVHAIPQARDQVEAVGVNGRVDVFEQVQAHSGRQRDALARVGDLHFVTVSGSILQLADDDSTSTLNLEKKRRDDRLWWLASMLIFAGALV